MAVGKKQAEAAKDAAQYTKEQLLSSKQYARYQDLLGALLNSEESYSHKEVEENIEQFLKGQVN